MASSGERLPASGFNTTGIGTLAWTNPGQCIADDTYYAQAIGTAGQTLRTNYLGCQNFGFDAVLPNPCNITGVQVRIKRYATYQSGTRWIIDAAVRLRFTGGQALGNNKADTVTQWIAVTPTDVLYGGDGDTWGLALTRADVVDPGFGAYLSVDNVSSTTSNVAYVGVIGITIFYTTATNQRVQSVTATSVAGNVSPVLRAGARVASVLATAPSTAPVPVGRGAARVSHTRATAPASGPTPVPKLGAKVVHTRATAPGAGPVPVPKLGAKLVHTRATAPGAAPVPVPRGAAKVTHTRATATGAALGPVPKLAAKVVQTRATATGAAPAPIVSTGGATRITAPAATAPAAAPVPVPKLGAKVAQTRATATAAAPAPIGKRGVKIVQTRATATGAAPVPVPKLGLKVTQTRATATGAAPGPVLKLGGKVVQTRATAAAAAPGPIGKLGAKLAQTRATATAAAQPATVTAETRISRRTDSPAAAATAQAAVPVLAIGQSYTVNAPSASTTGPTSGMGILVMLLGHAEASAAVRTATVTASSSQPEAPGFRITSAGLGMGGSPLPGSYSRVFPKLGRPLPDWRNAKKPVQPSSQRQRDVKFTSPRNLNYQKVKAEVQAAIALLPPVKQSMIPASGTLPEQMVGLALAWLDLPAEAQISEQGGRKRLGGSVVDWKVGMGTEVVVVRVQGDYWHSKGDRKLIDLVQYERLHRLHYLVVDMWESDLYEAWGAGRLKEYVREKLLDAA